MHSTRFDNKHTRSCLASRRSVAERGGMAQGKFPRNPNTLQKLPPETTSELNPCKCRGKKKRREGKGECARPMALFDSQWPFRLFLFFLFLSFRPARRPATVSTSDELLYGDESMSGARRSPASCRRLSRHFRQRPRHYTEQCRATSTGIGFQIERKVISPGWLPAQPQRDDDDRHLPGH